GPTVIRDNHPLRMGRVNPQAMVIPVWRAYEIEALAAVGRSGKSGIQDVDRPGVLGIRKNVMKVPSALRKAMVRIDNLPTLAGIVGSVEATLFCFDDGVHSIAIRSGNRDTDPAKDPARQPVPLQPLPGRAIVV